MISLCSPLSTDHKSLDMPMPTNPLQLNLPAPAVPKADGRKHPAFASAQRRAMENFHTIFIRYMTNSLDENKVPHNSLEDIFENMWEEAETVFNHTHYEKRKSDSPQMMSIIDFNPIGKKNLLEGEDIPIPTKDHKPIVFTPLSILIQSRDIQRNVCEEFLDKNRTVLIFPFMKNRERVDGVFRCIITNKR